MIPLMRTATSVSLLVLSYLPTLAQSPQKTTASYGDWTVECVMSQGGKKLCALVQVQRIPGQAYFTSRTVLIPAIPNGRFSLSIQVPTNVWLPDSARLILDQTDAPFDMPFKWCVPTRCLADVILTTADIGKLRSQTKPERITYKSATQADISVPLSFKGFKDAMDALGKE
jgi:invasion protein IalB